MQGAVVLHHLKAFITGGSWLLNPLLYLLCELYKSVSWIWSFCIYGGLFFLIKNTMLLLGQAT